MKQKLCLHGLEVKNQAQLLNLAKRLLPGSTVKVKIKEKYFTGAIKEYEKRLSKYTKLNIVELSDCGIEELDKSLRIEKDAIMKHLFLRDYIILLDVKGKEMTSIEMAKVMADREMNNSNITFIIGGSNGFHQDIYNIAKEKWSFSKLTFPHQLFRIMFLEQLYRTYKIRNNEKYHK